MSVDQAASMWIYKDQRDPVGKHQEKSEKIINIFSYNNKN